MAIDPLYATYHYSHPPFAERLEAIENESQAQERGSADVLIPIAPHGTCRRDSSFRNYYYWLDSDRF